MERELLYKFFEGTATYEEECSIRKWMEENPKNRQILIKERRCFDALILQNPEISNSSINLKKIALTFIRIAAIIILTFLGTSLYYRFLMKENTDTSIQTIYVPAGQRINITLSDGSNVWLNANTKLQYPAVFNGKERSVYLDGEAFFDIAKNKEKPFVVETKNCELEVLGTSFNVEAYTDNTNFSVALMTGSLRLSSKIDSSDIVTLKPSQMASFDSNFKITSSEIEDYNIYRWREGLICFKAASFITITDALEKYFGMTITVKNQNVLKNVYTGKFRQSDGLEYALRVLQKDIQFRYERDDENQIIYIL